MDLHLLTREQKRTGIALLLVRLAAAAAFLYHGYGILMHPQMLTQNGMPFFVAVLVGLGEFCGGLAMLTGVFARLGSAGLIVIMLGAIFMVHWKNGFDATQGGFEYPLTQLLIAAAILISGPGPYSLVALFRPMKQTAFTETPSPQA